MQLQSLTLSNIGVYRGAQSIRFSSDPSKPITLIGGKNGTGKTSLLDSIPLVLYGNRARRILNGVSYPEYLHGLVHHGEASASVSIEFVRTESGQPVNYVVERSWRRTSHGHTTDNLQVTTNLSPRPDLTAAWPEYVEGIMPMAVADLTIFDGEKIESLADPASSAEVLRTSLFGLLGLDLIDRLQSDLRNYRRRAAKAHDSGSSARLGDRLKEAEQRVNEAREQRTLSGLELDAAQAVVDERQAELQRATDSLSRAGGNLYAEREQLQRELAESTALGNAVERDLLRLAASDLPLAVIPELLKRVMATGEECYRAAMAAELESAVTARDRRLVDQIAVALALDVDESEVVRKLLQTDRENLVTPVSPRWAPTPDATETARSLIHHRANELQDEGRRLATQLSEHNATSEHLERTLAIVPDAEGIAASFQAVANAEAELQIGEQSLERALLACTDIDRRLNDAQRDLDAAAHEILNSRAGDTNAARIAREVAAADVVLSEFANRMVRKHLGRITDEINAALRKLLRKNGLVKEMRIDPSDLSVILLDNDQRAINTRRLSAGERQIMATAVLWGLSRSTGMTLPTIIDTPLGRLDRSHRTNLVELYFPNAARQVVLLSTDEEIVGEHLTRLMAHVGASYRLDFDEIHSCSSIQVGYLDE